MTRKLVLHIGASKTGSSAIQSFLRLNREYFLENGYFIPDAELGTSTKISGAHVFVLQNLITKADKTELKNAFNNLNDFVPKKKTILISAENLSNLGRHAMIESALDKFDTKVILYIRRQDDYLQSAWQQWHSKIEHDMDAWLFKGLRQYGHWDRLIKQWQSVVGKNNVIVRLFERSAMEEGDLLRDFLFSLGLDPRSDTPEFDLGTVNPSYSDLITPLVAGNTQIFDNSHDSGFYNMVGRLTGDKYVKYKKISLMSEKQREAILFYFRDINQRVCDEFFPDRRQLFTEIDHSKYLYLTESELIKHQMQFLTQLIFEIDKERKNTI